MMWSKQLPKLSGWSVVAHEKKKSREKRADRFPSKHCTANLNLSTVMSVQDLSLALGSVWRQKRLSRKQVAPENSPHTITTSLALLTAFK